MTIHATQRIIDMLFGPKIKVVFAAADTEAAERVMAAGGPETNGVEPLSFDPESDAADGRLQELAGADGEFVSLAAPPSGLCALAALSEEGHRQLEAFAAWWRKHGGGAPPTVLELHRFVSAGPDDNDRRLTELYGHLLHIAWESIGKSDASLANLSGELYELRQEYEQTRHALRRWQAELDRVKKTTCHMVYVMPESERTFRPEHDCTVRQLLPISAEGLAGFDLFCPVDRTHNGRQGCLVVVLHDTAAQRALAHWRIPYDAFGRGWCGFMLPEALTDAIHRPEVSVMWQTTGGRPLSLALSPIGAFDEMAARVDGKSIGAALAFIAWGALPGARIDTKQRVWCQLHDADAESHCLEYRLDFHDVARVTATATAEFNYMHLLPDVPGFRLHPLEHRLATAVLSRACPAGTDRLVATAEIRRDEAKHPVEYAMCLTDASLECRVFPDAPERDERVVGFSGWQSVASDGRPHAVTLSLAEPLTELADLHFGTRMSGSRAITYHCADWLELRIRLQHSVADRLEAPDRQ
ncbi:MAG: DUF6212 domain-containing protein [Planctomycetota bacterium]|nr:DUF6212 domain-containing protein [Planctomycetota bacterium]